MLQKAIFDSTEIYKLLTQLGADLHYIGFRYTEYALLLMGEDEQCIHSVTKCLYPEIARRYQTSCHAVERNTVPGGLEIRTRPPSKNGGSFT